MNAAITATPVDEHVRVRAIPWHAQDKFFIFMPEGFGVSRI